MHAMSANPVNRMGQTPFKSTSAAPHSPVASSPESRVLVIDTERRLIRASLAGEILLKEERGLRLSLDRVRGVSRIDDETLDRAITAAARGWVLETTLPLGPKGMGLSVSVVPLLAASASSDILLLVRDAREERRRTLARAVAFFGFTGAESRLVYALFEGCSVPDAAERLGVAPTTARSHLQSVFSKTGVRRQGDLMTLLVSAA